MFSQIFNKARGLFPGAAADNSSFTAHASASETATDSSIDSTPTTISANMVTATRRGQIGSPSPQAIDSSDAAANGKRKTRTTRSDSQSNKRRRTESEEDDEDNNIETKHTSVVVEIPLRRKFIEENATDEVSETQQTNGISNGVEATDESQSTTTSTPPKNANNHIRFGSEEPAPVLNVAKEIPDSQPEEEDKSSSDDDDEAPEVVDNSVQLMSLKMQAQKQEEARKRSVVLVMIFAKHKF